MSKKIAIVVGSSADLAPEEALKRNIFVIRKPLIVDGESYIEAEEYTVEQLSEALAEGKKIATSQPSIGQLTTMWDELLMTHDQILYIPISVELSGTFANAYALSQEEHYKNKVFVVKSRFVSYAIVDLCEDIRELIERGIDLESIVARIENEVDERAILVPYDLHTLKNGGRIKPAVASLAGLLKIQVLIEFDNEGKLEQFDKVRTLNKAYTTAVNEICNVDNPKQYHWGVVHADIDEEATKIKTIIEEKTGQNVAYAQLRSIIRAHTGNKSIAIYRITKLV